MAVARLAEGLPRESRQSPAAAGRFGRLLREFRLAAGLTQEALAERASTSARGISDLERGVRQVPQRETVRLLAEALGLAGADLAAFVAAGHRPSRPRPVLASGRASDLPLPPLPLPPTPLVGREREVALVGERLRDPAVRLVALTGPGGVGKTRLALEVAHGQAPLFPDGVVWVELGGLSDPGLVPAAVAQALGVREGAGRSLVAALHDRLRGRRLLLVLDNCEHLVEGVRGFVADLLAACLGPAVLATSRARLRLRAEHAVPVPPLALPDRSASVVELGEAEAVRLFVARARMARADFALTEANAATVAEVCRRLDGLPLALELAAARLGQLSPQALAALLGDRLRLLTGGPADAPPRQRTLRATIGWSHDLLGPEEQVFFRRLAVSAGGCDLEAAAAVAGDGDPFAALDALSALADQSLLAIEELPDGAPRFRMLETVRADALDRLEASGEAEAIRWAHAARYLALAEQAAPALLGPDQDVWLDRLAIEHDNFRAALAWGLLHEAGMALRLATALWRFWEIRGHLGEGREWLERVLAAGVAAPHPEGTRLRVGALYGAGVLAVRQGDLGRAAALFEETLALHRALGDQQGIARSLNSLGNVAYHRGDLGRAAALYDESLALLRGLGDQPGIAAALTNLGSVVRDQGDLGRAAVLYEQGLALMRATGNRWGVAVTLTTLGTVAHDLGDLPRAAALHEEALRLRRRLEDRWGMAASLNCLGNVARDQGDLAGAAALHEEALALQRALGDREGVAYSLTRLASVVRDQGDLDRAAALGGHGLSLRLEVGDRHGIAFSLEALGAIARAGGQPAWAVRLFGAAAALRDALGTPLSPSYAEEHARDLGAMQQQLGDDAFAEAWAAGRALTLDEVAAEALTAVDVLPSVDALPADAISNEPLLPPARVQG